ncbi:MAG TPA: histidine kinase dimerization/phospho-acceptor domain-containing protein [Usitatibacter sp.]|jgi:signal transduction histidine kinase|nr:histidine kinase dimerization/phospho-acceptor domain-containing protein [Usitatibacter sp.]
MTTTILKMSRDNAARADVGRLLRDAGFGVVEVDDWDAAAQAATGTEPAIVVGDAEVIELARGPGPADAPPRDMMRQLSHELRTPLSAMAGWLHLLESGKLDAAGTKRAIEKLRGNIEDQVRTIDRYLASTSQKS